MHMKATITGDRLAGILKVPPRAWFNAGNGLRQRIVLRTRRSHVDADGNPFAPYSPEYARQKGGRAFGTSKRRAQASVLRTNVDLTGVSAGPKMLDTIKVTARGDSNPRIELWFALAEKAAIASYHMGEGRVDRKFFGLSDDDIDYVVQYVKDWVRTGRGSERG